MLYPHLGINKEGHLTVGGLDAVALAKEYGTPLYLLDEDVIRENCRTYRAAAKAAFGENAKILYASKALSYKGIYRLMAEEGLGVDCVSCGEIRTAVAAGMPAANIYFHGNNKTDEDLRTALSLGVGRIVVDNEDELRALSAIAEEMKKRQCILLRITPGIDPHTHRAVNTGRVDSKFGSAIATGQAAAITKEALTLPGVALVGYHCHIGSQIFDAEPFLDAARMMLDFAGAIHDETGFPPTELNLGGGFGVPYTATDPVPSYPDMIAALGKVFDEKIKEHGLPAPAVRLEPGRSLVAAAGVTLYTVGAVKEIPGFKTYISVDGGMPDNPRYALYHSQYTALIANRADAASELTATLAGRCCESGDLLGEDMRIARAARGDVLAVLTTGAYNYSMASNYNRIPRPPIVAISGENARLAVRRESFEDLMRNEL